MQMRALGTPANDIAIQLPALIAGNEWETAVSLLAGLSPEEMVQVSNRAIALYDVDPAVMAEIIRSAGASSEVIEVVGTIPTRKVPAWGWALLAAIVVGGGAYAYNKRRKVA